MPGIRRSARPVAGSGMTEDPAISMEQANAIAALSASQRLRLAFIEFRVWFYGEVARKHVLERFEVATAAGTSALRSSKRGVTSH